MKILITGSNGLLGFYLVRELLRAGHEILATGLGEDRIPASEVQDAIGRAGSSSLEGTHRYRYASLDIRDGLAVQSCIHAFRPAWVLHNAAWAQVDQCETQPVDCWAVNVTATRFLLDAAAGAGAAFLLVSTDFIFDGKGGPYTEEDPAAPVNYYGCSKRAAEKSVMAYALPWVIVRTVLVYGQSPTVKRFNLLTWVRDKLTLGESVSIVNDQWRTPTYAGDLARGIRLAMEKNAAGIFHISGAEMMTPFDMARATASCLQLDPELIKPVDHTNFSQAARRPQRTGFLIRKAREQLDYHPVPFATGLQKMLFEDPA